MKILFLDWPCFGMLDTTMTLLEMGHEVFPFKHDDYQQRISKDFNEKCIDFINNNSIEIAFSFNYYPVLAEACKQANIRYISFIYDSPYVFLYSYTVIYPTNDIFVFDSNEYIKLSKMGIPTVHYLPLPVNSTVIDVMLKKPYNKERVTCDVSFIGALYNEEHNFFDRLNGISDFTRGYLEGLMESQLQVQGYSFIEELLTPEITNDVNRVLNYDESKYGVETPQYIIANYVLCRRMTQLERNRLLTAAAEVSNLKLFTLDKKAVIPGATNMGIADYYEEMPLVFHESKINLNISLRSIISGIPLRCMDILGAGGFLLSNYQVDMTRHFVPGEDYDYFEDANDLQNKIEYYLSHEKERKEIAANGHRKAAENHSFKACFKEMFAICGLSS